MFTTIKWNQVTWYSKLGAFILLCIIVPALTFFIGMRYQEVRDIEKKLDLIKHEEKIAQREQFKIEIKNITSKQDQVEIKASYPKVSGSKADTMLNISLEKDINNIIVGLKKDYAVNNNSGDYETAIEIVATTSISAEYQVFGVKYDAFIINSRAAHPSLERKTFTYNLNTGTEISYLETLSLKQQKTKEEILGELSKNARKDLLKLFSTSVDQLLDSDEFNKGTEPNEQNFSNVILSDEGLLISFEEYQIGPRPFGSPDIFISYTDLGF